MLKRFIALFMAVMAIAIHADYLDEGFAAPPMQAKPQTWWHWLDYNISKEGIKADIDADLRRVVNLMYGECSSYVADMTQKGVMQMLSATDLRRVKRLLSGFDELYDIHLKSNPKTFIQNVTDHDDDGENEGGHGLINHYNMLFHISSDCVFEYIAPLRAALDKLNYGIKTVVTDCLMDTLIEEKTPVKIEPSKKIKKEKK
jgi:hypothetical protein